MLKENQKKMKIFKQILSQNKFSIKRLKKLKEILMEVYKKNYKTFFENCLQISHKK